MKNLFEKLNELIHHHADPSTFFDNPQSDLIKEQLEDCVSGLPLKFTNRTLTITSRKEMALLVQIAQSNTFVALNKITKYQLDKCDVFYEQVERELMKFVNFLYANYYPYFDTTATMPTALWSEWEGIVQSTITYLEEEEGIDPALPILLQKEFEENTRDSVPTFNAANYWNNLCQKLQENLANDKRDEVFIRTLIACNFNSSLFIQYISQKSEEDSQGNAFRNYLFRMAGTNDQALYEKKPSCKDQLMQWILQDPTDNGTAAITEKLEINLSVSQLGTLLWLLVQVGILRTQNISELIRKIAANVRTPKTANISAESLYNYYHTRQTAANNILKSILRNMLDKLHNVAVFGLAVLNDLIVDQCCFSVPEVF